MMTCQKLAEMLLEFVSGELEPEFHALIEEHIHHCSNCEAFVHSYRVTITITRKLPPLPLREDFARRLENLLKNMNEE